MSKEMDDLEEGEILDEDVPRPKTKQLPRRYENKNNNSNHSKKYKELVDESFGTKNSPLNYLKNKHKKHHKSCPKRNTDSLKFNSEHLDVVDKNLFKFHSFSKLSNRNKNSLPFPKSAFKNFTSPPRKVASPNGDANRSLKKTPLVPTNLPLSPMNSDDNFPSLLEEYKKVRKINVKPFDRHKRRKYSNGESCSKTLLSSTKIRIDLVKGKQDLLEKLPNSDLETSSQIITNENCEKSEDEDEDELRRIALATCIKRFPAQNSVVDDDITIISSTFPDQPSSCESQEKSAAVVKNDDLPLDNHEVVDMEIEDNENSYEGKSEVDLFVIDKIPTKSGTVDNYNGGVPYDTFVHSEKLSSIQTNDDFEEALLRAELIASMNAKYHKSRNSETESVCMDGKCQEPFESEPIVCMNTKYQEFQNYDGDGLVSISGEYPILQNFENGCVINTNFIEFKNFERVVEDSMNEKYHKFQNFESDCVPSMNPDYLEFQNAMKEVRRKEPFYPEIPFVETSDVSPSSVHSFVGSKPDRFKTKNVKLVNVVPLPNIISMPQQRIIITINNDSSSEESCEEDVSDMSNCTPQNNAVASIEALISNARQKSEVDMNVNNDNVSCLSKAQQEEYNALKKILAKTDKLSIPSQQSIEKKAETAHRNLLLKKINTAKENFKNELELINVTVKELNEKKQIYMKSKLKSQHLKEQLAAAERTKIADLQSWNKCSAKLTILKKSFLKHKEIIHLLQTQLKSKVSPLKKHSNISICTNNLSPNISS